MLKVLVVVVGCTSEISESHRDECGWYHFYKNSAHGDYFCNDRGMCQDDTHGSVAGVDCETAARFIAQSRGSVPLPERPDGLLHEPFIRRVRVWPPTEELHGLKMGLTGSPGLAVAATVAMLIDCVKSINAELEFWAPRILFVPERIASTLQKTVGVHQLLLGHIYRNPSAASYAIVTLAESSVMMAFTERIYVYRMNLLGAADIRTSGYLESLIPFLHVYATLTTMFILPRGGIFLIVDQDLLLTISQYSPGYAPQDRRWVFRILETHPEWDAHPDEVYLLPMGLLLELRQRDDILAALGCVPSQECITTIRARVEEGDPEYGKSLFALFDLSSDEDFRNRLREPIVRLMQLVPRTDERMRAMYFTHFKDQISLEFRLQWSHQLSQEWSLRSVLHNQQASPESAQMVEFVASLSMPSLHYLLISKTCRLWVQAFLDLIVAPRLVHGADHPHLQASVDKRTRRSVGRVLAYAVWRGDVKVSMFRAPTALHRLDREFLGSEQVRMGYYDWFAFLRF